MEAWTESGTRVTVADDFRLPAGFSTGEPSDDETFDEPPRGGAGSGVAAWRDHLETNGIDFGSDASRDELIEVWDTRG